jgi:hypothetical protein
MQHFQARHAREVAAYDIPPPALVRNNVAARVQWWSTTGRTLNAVLDHIEAGNS